MNYNLKPISLLAQDIQLVIVHNPLNQEGEIDEELGENLFGNIQRSLPELLCLLNEKTRLAVDDVMRGLFCNYEGAKPVALTLFGSIAKDPRSHARADLV